MSTYKLLSDATPWKPCQRIVKNKTMYYVARTITEYTKVNFERCEDAAKLAEQWNKEDAR